MLSASLALENHNHNFVYPTIQPPTAQFHAHEIAVTASAEPKCSSSSEAHENEQKKAQRNLQQHQLHAQFLHEQYLSQQTVSSLSPASSSSSPSPSSSSLSLSSPSSSSNSFDLFGKPPFLPPSTAVLENWRNDLLFITSASDSFSHSRKTSPSASNATCTITSGSFQSMKQSPFDINLTSNSTISEIDNNHKFLVPKVPNKTSVSSNRNSKKEHHYSQQNQKNDQSSKITPSKNNESESIINPSTTDQIGQPNLKFSENKSTLKILSGKEGSLKHRILTSFSPEKEEVLDEPEDLSVKNIKPVISSYLEKTKACSVSSVPLRLSSLTSPTSSTVGIAAGQQTQSEHKKRKRSSKIEFKKAHSFLKGLSIKMDTGTIRKIEEMTTDDLLQSIDLRPDLIISNMAITSMFADSTDSTNNKINVVGRFNGSNKKKEISIKRSDPFFVYGTGWASYDPEMTKSVYGADCKRLSAGDVIIMLKNKTKSLSVSSLPNKKAKTRRPETIVTLSSAKLVAHAAEPNSSHSQNSQIRNKQKKENEALNSKPVAAETVAILMTDVDDDDCSMPTKKKKQLSPIARNSYPGYPQNFHHPSQVSFDLQIQAQLLQQQQQQQQHDQQQQYHSPLFPHTSAHFQPFAYSPYAYHPYPLSYQQFYFPQTSITHHTHISNTISPETESNLK